MFPHRKQNIKHTQRNTQNQANQNQFQISKRFCAKSRGGGEFEPSRNANFFRPACNIFELSLINPLSSIIRLQNTTHFVADCEWDIFQVVCNSVQISLF